MDRNKIAIIGAGASGLFAAASFSNFHSNTLTVFEKNPFTGKKLLITGKGRCNVTNAANTSDFFKNIPVNPRFLYSSLSSFTNFDTIDFFEEIGVPLKTERGERVFPTSDKAVDIRNALYNKALSNHAEFIHTEVNNVLKCEEGFKVFAGEKEYYFDKVIIATGGLSYPLTGSTGDGYKFAKKLSHTVTALSPSLVPLVCNGNLCKELMGLSLKNVALKIYDKRIEKFVYEDFGEMIFTHYGISGPMVLSASSHLRDISSSPDVYIAHIDLKPALENEKLNTRLLSDFEKYKNKDFQNSLKDLLPSKLIPVIIRLSGIDSRKKVNEITREERYKLIGLLKDFSLTIHSARPISEAIITSGGVNVSEINPKTMESKKVPGLYFAGEIIDVDAYTGGFNLQIAFSTAYAAIKSAQID
ncbi:MAG: NAD(P)/FAD-dependent oxidoreductase [Ruminococcaceae bacterium]|nr:NAD(P)/FAD-dependent oxidoreductase [Oscillospiraceae bacterium]